MAGRHFLRGLIALGLWVLQAQAKSVFAHFMLSNTAGFSVADYQKEIGLAQEAHIDGFAVNFSMDEDTTDSQLPIFFAAAESKGFKLFLSFDYAGNGAWPKSLVSSMISKYAASSAYFRRGGQPLVSTFEGPNNAPDWPSIKQETNCFFVPSFSSLGAKKAVATGVVDGLFSWAGWREGPNRMDTQVDASYMDYLNGLPYMMPVAPWFYTNMPGFKKNWLWKGDDLWFDRWAHVWYLQPEFVQIISWNDYGESHYIGPLDERQYTAFGEDRGRSPFNYVRDMPHDGWRDILPYVIDMYKNNQSTVTRETLTTWYRLSPAGACSNGGTTGNTVSQHQTEYAPGELAEDRIYYSALLGSSATVSVSIGGRAQAQWAWDTVPDGGVGVYHGSVPFSGTGQVVVSLSRGGVSVTGPAITTDCSKNGGLTNWNAWVGSAKASGGISATPALTLGEQTCIRGVGVAEFGAAKENFEGVCDFACSYGYCPRGPCSCTQMGAKRKEPESLNIDAWPAAGRTCTYGGLCSFACNHKYCPAECTTDKSLEGKCLIPQPIPEPEPAPGETPLSGCVAGKGEGNYGGLCGFSCGRGYCPEPCECTEKGSIIPPPATSAVGYPLNTMGQLYIGLCDFACSRGYCPESACTQTKPTLPGVFKEYTGSSEFEKCKKENVRPWQCYQKQCGKAGNLGLKPSERWAAIPCQEALEDMFSWWELITKIVNDGSPNILPAWLRSSMPIAIGWAWGTPHDGETSTELRTDYSCHKLGANGCVPIKCDDITNSPVAMVEMSIGNVKNFFQKQADALTLVEIDLPDLFEDIASTFVRPKITFLSGFKTVMESLDQLMAFTGAGFWAKALSEKALEAWTETTEGAASILGAATSAVDAYEFVAGEVKDREALTIQDVDDVTEAGKAAMKLMRATIDEYLKLIYSGSPKGTETAVGLMSGGAFVLNPLQDLSENDVAKVIKTTITARLITNIWATDDQCAPVVAIGDFDITTPQRDLNFDLPWIAKARMDYDNKKLTVICVSTQKSAFGKKRQTGLTLNVQPPTGLTDIFDKDNKFGVQWQNLTRSAYDGWKVNGEKLPYGIPDTADSATGGPDSPTYLPFQQGIATPGFWQVPVCAAKKVQDNVRWLFQKGGPKCKDVYPCCDVTCTQVKTATGGTLWVCG